MRRIEVAQRHSDERSLKRIGVQCSGSSPGSRHGLTVRRELRVLQRGASNLHYAQTAAHSTCPVRLRRRRPAGADVSAALREDSDFRMLKEIPPVRRTAVTRIDHHRYEARASPPDTRVHSGSGGGRRRGAELPARSMQAAPGSARRDPARGVGVSHLSAQRCTRRRTWSAANRGAQVRSVQPFSRVLLFERLREVRAMTGFRRCRHRRPRAGDLDGRSPSDSPVSGRGGVRRGHLPAVRRRLMSSGNGSSSGCSRTKSDT